MAEARAGLGRAQTLYHEVQHQEPVRIDDCVTSDSKRSRRSGSTHPPKTPSADFKRSTGAAWCACRALASWTSELPLSIAALPCSTAAFSAAMSATTETERCPSRTAFGVSGFVKKELSLKSM